MLTPPQPNQPNQPNQPTNSLLSPSPSLILPVNRTECDDPDRPISLPDENTIPCRVATCCDRIPVYTHPHAPVHPPRRGRASPRRVPKYYRPVPSPTHALHRDKSCFILPMPVMLLTPLNLINLNPSTPPPPLATALHRDKSCFIALHPSHAQPLTPPQPPNPTPPTKKKKSAAVTGSAFQRVYFNLKRDSFSYFSGSTITQREQRGSL